MCKQIDRVHRARLAKAVDPADALLEANWVPRQFEIHDEAAPALKVQPLRTCVRRQQHIGRAVVEGLDCSAALLPRQAAMQDRQTPHALNRRFKREQRVAIFSEDHRRLADPVQQPLQRGDFALAGARARGGRKNLPESVLFFIQSIEHRRGERGIGVGDVLVGIEGQTGLKRIRCVAGQQRQAPLDRECQRRRAGKRTLAQNGGDELSFRLV